MCWHHPCLWPNVQLGVLIRGTDAEFSQITVSTSLNFSGESNATSCTLSLRPLMDPHQWLRQQTMREFRAGQYFSFKLRGFVLKWESENRRVVWGCYLLHPAGRGSWASLWWARCRPQGGIDMTTGCPPGWDWSLQSTPPRLHCQTPGWAATAKKNHNSGIIKNI